MVHVFVFIITTWDILRLISDICARAHEDLERADWITKVENQKTFAPITRYIFLFYIHLVCCNLNAGPTRIRVIYLIKPTCLNKVILSYPMLKVNQSRFHEVTMALITISVEQGLLTQRATEWEHTVFNGFVITNKSEQIKSVKRLWKRKNVIQIRSFEITYTTRPPELIGDPTLDLDLQVHWAITR